MARRRRRTRRNPGIFEGAGDSELILTMALAGGAVWLAYALYQSVTQAITSAETAAQQAMTSAETAAQQGVQYLEALPGRAATAIEAPFVSAWDSLENWFGDGSAPAPTDGGS
jgi:hypothetical protein